MSQILDTAFGDRITQRRREYVIAVRDIRTADLHRGVLESDSVEIVIKGRRFPPKGGQMVESTVRDLEQVHRVGEVIAGRLRSHGFDSVEAVAAADHDELTQVTGIGEVRAREIRQSATKLLGTVC